MNIEGNKIYALSMESPLLSVGSSYSSLREDIREWLEEHMQDRYRFGFAEVMGGYYLMFFDDYDYTYFLLRWL